MLFFKGAFPGLRALIDAIHKELKSLQPKDSSTIRWTRDSSGMAANLVTPVTNAGGLPAEAEDSVTASGRIGGLISGPSGGSGAAVWREAVDAADGTWTATGATVPVRVLTLK